MERRFSAQHLYQLRNSIPIDALIEEKLSLPCKQSEGFFRFLCPLCGEFQTATMKKTNLARCFRCEKNFNTIDLVMLCTNTSFVESVKFLTACLKRPAARKNPFSQRRKELGSIGELSLPTSIGAVKPKRHR